MHVFIKAVRERGREGRGGERGRGGKGGGRGMNT